MNELIGKKRKKTSITNIAQTEGVNPDTQFLSTSNNAQFESEAQVLFTNIANPGNINPNINADVGDLNADTSKTGREICKFIMEEQISTSTKEGWGMEEGLY